MTTSSRGGPQAGPPAPEHTPAPALLEALAHVGEVDLATGLGRRRLAEVTHEAGAAPERPDAPPPARPDLPGAAASARRRWLALGWLLLAAICALLLALG